MSGKVKTWSYNQGLATKKKDTASFYQLGDNMTIMSNDIKIGGAEKNWKAVKPKVNPKTNEVVLTADERRSYVYDTQLRIAGTPDRVMAARMGASAAGVGITPDNRSFLLTAASLNPGSSTYNLYMQELTTKNSNAARAKKIKSHPFSQAKNIEAIWLQLKDAKKVTGGGTRKTKGPLGAALLAMVEYNNTTEVKKRKAADVTNFTESNQTYRSVLLPSSTRSSFIAGQEAKPLLPMISKSRDGYVNALRWLQVNNPRALQSREPQWYLDQWDAVAAAKAKSATARPLNIPTTIAATPFGATQQFGATPFATPFGQQGVSSFGVASTQQFGQQPARTATPLGQQGVSSFGATPFGATQQLGQQGVSSFGATQQFGQQGVSSFPSVRAGNIPPARTATPLGQQGVSSFGVAPTQQPTPATTGDPLGADVNLGNFTKATGSGDKDTLALMGLSDVTQEDLGGTVEGTVG